MCIYAHLYFRNRQVTSLQTDTIHNLFAVYIRSFVQLQGI